MSLFDKVRRQKLLSISLLLFTLSIGIVIGTLVSTGVRAAKDQVTAKDATPLITPPISKMPSNQFVDLAKRMEPTVINISTEYSAKPSSRPGTRGKRSPDDEEDEHDDR